MDHAIATKDLTKSFNKHLVVDHVNMHVRTHSIYGFVGPNGAGKSTIMKMLLHLVQPDSGEVKIFGKQVTDKSYEIFKHIGSIIENAYFYDGISARDNLQLHCEYMGYPDFCRIDEVLRLVDLDPNMNKAVKHYSLGMKQRLAIARAILTKPELLILDEPINALDPEGIREMRNLLKKLNEEYGTTILISSHILSEVELIADDIGVIKNGSLIKELTLQDIHDHQTEYIHLEVDDVTKCAQILDQMKVSNLEIVDNHTIRIYRCPLSGIEITRELARSGIGVESIWKKQDTLEDYFFELLDGDDQ
ncbi:MAG: ABC transporter ATP-binding protein [Absicoccus porci]|uniref:ABC transporter ATP-binding protein n=1 Tax=Absicoccus porci TaxID=2486576 RepID=UPI002409BC5A|nr:ABC transporter ATP-binding protein [Absicoccus porci]MDD6459411.1 ABC transporter ATP-binding protein [Absicoccus porci]